MRNMFLWAAFAVVTGAFFAKYIFAVSAFASFNIGTAAGDLFGVYSFDPGGGRLHSGWFIFCCIFFYIIVILPFNIFFRIIYKICFYKI